MFPPWKGRETYCFSPCVCLSICCLSITKWCPLYNLITVKNVSTKLHTFVNYIQTMGHAQESLLVHVYFLKYSPCFDLIFTSHQQSFSYKGTGLLGLNLARINVLAQGHNAVTPVRLEPAALLSQVKHSTTEPLHSLYSPCNITKCNFLSAL